MGGEQECGHTQTTPWMVQGPVQLVIGPESVWEWVGVSPSGQHADVLQIDPSQRYYRVG